MRSDAGRFASARVAVFCAGIGEMLELGVWFVGSSVSPAVTYVWCATWVEVGPVVVERPFDLFDVWGVGDRVLFPWRALW